jgi:LmbE family N-acetylglucosaminyl deacetylase
LTKRILALAGTALLAAGAWAGAANNIPQPNSGVILDAMPVDVERGTAGLSRWLAAIRTRASLLMIVAHPDDEDGGMLAAETRGRGTRTAQMTLNRGEGGQNAMSVDMDDDMGLLRTQELLQAGRYYGVDQYWGSVVDYGFSKTREEALEKWGYERVLSDVVRVVRMTRPLVLTSVFMGAPTDGHGNHQVAGQMTQEAFLAAGDPKRFPEQFKEGLRPWQPLKVYERVPNFARTKDKTIYDYATSKYVPLRFHDYVHDTWLTEQPAANVEVQEGAADPAAGLTFLQIARTGWGYQKSQYGGNLTPQPTPFSVSYHRYGSRVQTADKESSFYDGVDTSLPGIAALATGDTAFLKTGLTQIAKFADDANDNYKPGKPASIAPTLADGLKATRALLRQVESSSLAEPGKSDVAFELQRKEDQFQKALALALEVSFNAAVAPERGGDGRFGGGSQAPTFTVAIPGQAFSVEAFVTNSGSENVSVESVNVVPSDGKQWTVHPEKSPEPTLAGGKQARLKFAVTAPADAVLTKAYFSRPNTEQPYYNINDPRYRNLSLAPYPLAASLVLSYRGADFTIRKVVQTNQRVEGIGLTENPLLMGPAISVSVSPSAGAVPVSAKQFTFSCTLRSNVKGAAAGIVRLHLPEGWTSLPAEAHFQFAHDDASETLAFQVTPRSVEPRKYEIQAVAEYQGKTYNEGYRMVGYPGIRPYPSYRASTYEAVGVDVKTAPDLHIGFLPGTGDDVPRALEDLGTHLQILSGSDLESGDLSSFNAIVLGVRAYAVRPDLRASNHRLLDYVKNGGVLIVQYNVQNFDRNYGPYPFKIGNDPQKVVDEDSKVTLVDPSNAAFAWPNKINVGDFKGWSEERGHGFMESWDPQYKPLVETHDPGQDPQLGGLLVAHYGKGVYVYDAFALYRQLPSGVPGAYRLLANLVSLGKNPEWK